MSVCPSSSIHLSILQKLTSIPASILQNSRNENGLVCYKSEKYVFWVTHIPPGVHGAFRAAPMGQKCLLTKVLWNDSPIKDPLTIWVNLLCGLREAASILATHSAWQGKAGLRICRFRAGTFPRIKYFVFNSERISLHPITVPSICVR